jgi:hypothetical protein
MIKFIISCTMVLFTSLSCTSQNNDKKNIEMAIQGFSKAGDENNADLLQTYLDDNYRIIMNRLFGSSSVTILSKEMYSEKIRTKEYGGDKRIVKISQVIINGNSAFAKVNFKGSKMTFESLILLVKDGEGKWKLISDVPVVL